MVAFPIVTVGDDCADTEPFGKVAFAYTCAPGERLNEDTVQVPEGLTETELPIVAEVDSSYNCTVPEVAFTVPEILLVVPQYVPVILTIGIAFTVMVIPVARHLPVSVASA
ncbi:hypothetical protein D3C85_955350 [compost metagenome]